MVYSSSKHYSQPSIGVINLGISNVKSIQYISSKLGYDCSILSAPSEVQSEKILILPGVGAYDAGVSALNSSQWHSFLKEFVSDRTNLIVGICLGMQLMFEGSEEGSLSGLSFLPGRIQKLRTHNLSLSSVKLPNIGWKYVSFTDHKFMNKNLSSQLPDHRFYFVHSYAHYPPSEELTLATCDYPVPFSAAVSLENVIGFQFHPEKSHRFGISLLSLVFSSVLK